MKVRSKDAADTAASFALLFVQNYAIILDLSDKIYTGGWWIPKCCFFTALKSDNAHVHMCTCSTTYGKSTIQFHFSISPFPQLQFQHQHQRLIALLFSVPFELGPRRL